MSDGGEPGLEALLLEILRAHPRGLSEYALLRKLQEVRRKAFPADLFKHGLAMFQAHFLLFHALHRLRDRLGAEGAGWLDIDVLRIVLRPASSVAGEQGVARGDPLRAYYLDLDNLRDTDAAEVESMLGQFWVRYFANEQRAAALSTLGLCDPVDASAIKRRYRRLAMQHHPDRGGDLGRFQRLQAAMDVLERC
jgi:DnaJ-domain-containing protein 1